MTTGESTRHGHHNGYYVDGCRCDLCKAACAAYTRMMRAKRRANIPLHDEGSRHLYANFGCRCELCKAANATYLAEFRARPGNKQKAVTASRKWANDNADKYRLRRRTYQRAYNQLKRIRLLAVEKCEVTVKDWERLCRRFDECCFYCGQRQPLTMDHVIPIARGGRHSIGNLIPACRSCNARKRTRLIVEWRAGRKAAA